MDEIDTSIRPTWKAKDIIRNKLTGHPYKVLHVFNYNATIIVDLEDRSPLPLMYSLLPREYSNYAKDSDMEFNEFITRKPKFEFKPTHAGLMDL